MSQEIKNGMLVYYEESLKSVLEDIGTKVHDVDNSNTWYNLPYWFRWDGKVLIAVPLDNIPEDVKQIIKDERDGE